MARVAILIDGDNISASHAAGIAALGTAAGRVDLIRAYADAGNGSGWNAVPGVRLMHAGTGKNAADLLLSIDAIELALTAEFETFVLASSDGDFTHLATRLRELGLCVIGAGEGKAPAAFRAACTRFECLSPVRSVESAPSDRRPDPVPGATELDRRIRSVIAQNSHNGSGMLLADLNAKMRAGFEIKISTRPEGTWRAYLGNRPHLYDLDPRGTQAHVRFKPKGFAD